MELHYRFALPVAAIVLALVGIPLGISTRKGGKSLGVMLSLLLFFFYYILMAFGLSFAKQGRVSPIIGLWLANVLFALAGIFMLSNLSRVWTRMMFLQDAYEDLVKRWKDWRARRGTAKLHIALPVPAKVGGRFLQILDIYVLSGWIFYLPSARRLYRRVPYFRFLPGSGRYRAQLRFPCAWWWIITATSFPKLFT